VSCISVLTNKLFAAFMKQVLYSNQQRRKQAVQTVAGSCNSTATRHLHDVHAWCSFIWEWDEKQSDIMH